MEQIVKIDIAKNIIDKLIAQECKNGVDKNNKMLSDFVQMKNEIYKNNTTVIDFVISEYKKALTVGAQNG